MGCLLQSRWAVAPGCDSASCRWLTYDVEEEISGMQGVARPGDCCSVSTVRVAVVYIQPDIGQAGVPKKKMGVCKTTTAWRLQTDWLSETTNCSLAANIEGLLLPNSPVTARPF